MQHPEKDEEAGIRYRYWVYHLALMMAGGYIAVLLTNWRYADYSVRGAGLAGNLTGAVSRCPRVCTQHHLGHVQLGRLCDRQGLWLDLGKDGQLVGAVHLLHVVAHRADRVAQPVRRRVKYVCRSY